MALNTERSSRCIPAGSTLSATYQGCVRVCVLNPKGHDAQPTYQVTTFTVNVQVSRILLWGITLSSGLRAGQVAPRCQAALCVQGMPAVRRREHLLGPLLLTQPHATQCTCDVAAGVQFKKLLVWSQFGPLTNEAGTSGDVAGDDWAGSLTAGTHRSHLVIT